LIIPIAFTKMPLSHSRLIIALCVLLQKPDSVVGWSTEHHSARRQRLAFGTRWCSSIGRSSTNSSLFLSSSPSNDNDSDENESTFVVEDEECFDLCDIDWDLMPATDDEDVEEEKGGANNSSETVEPETSAAAPTRTEKAPVDPGTMRVRLEMLWKARENADECDIVELDSCGEFCSECAGRGTVQCRFCHGATKIPMGSKMMDCPVCNQLGHEPCKACKGSGRIAGWTGLLDYTTKR
jgi:hypothetical protein